MSDTMETIKQLRARHVALDEEKRMELLSQRECEAKAREHYGRYFACKQEQQNIVAALATHNAALMEEQALTAAQKAQQEAEKSRAEANAKLTEVDAKLAELNAALAKANEPKA